MSASVIRQLNLSRGVITLKIPSFIGVDNLIDDAVKYSLESNYLKKGDKIVCIMGQQIDTPDNLSLMKIAIV